MNSVHNLESLIKIQHFVKSKVRILISLRKEVEYIHSIIRHVLYRLEQSSQLGIVKPKDYKKFMLRIGESNRDMAGIHLQRQKCYTAQLTLARVKLSIIQIMKQIGSKEVSDILSFILSFSPVDAQYAQIAHFYNDHFHPTSCSVYQSKNNISYELADGSNSVQNIQLTTFQMQYPTCNKLSIFSKSLTMKLYGAKLYFPCGSKLLVVQGYFQKDNFNLYKSHTLFRQKYQEVQLALEQLEYPPFRFSEAYLNQVSIRDFILYSKSKLIERCTIAYKDVTRILSKNISTIIKDFIMGTLDKQIHLIRLFLLESSLNSDYIAYLLYDLICSDTTLETNGLKNHTILYHHLHWTLQNKLKNSEVRISEMNEKMIEYSEKKIPYDKRIHLLKADNYVKSKAFEKYKEICNSKGNENNAKAQHYLDGLLKIPFGVYKIEQLKHHLNDTVAQQQGIFGKVVNVLQQIEESSVLCDDSLEITDSLRRLATSSNTSIQHFNTLHRKVETLLALGDETVSTALLEKVCDVVGRNKCKISIVREMCQVVGLPVRIGQSKKLKTKKVMLGELRTCKTCTRKQLKQLQALVDSSSTASAPVPFNPSETDESLAATSPSSTSSCRTVTSPSFIHLCESTHFEQLSTQLERAHSTWATYKQMQHEYFSQVDTILDEAVYGSKEAKNQIKHIIAQWVNGENTGYVFGFEGPPGTGKTTLAKQGIAKCLRDEDGNNRPFIFIALGGSSNGSTLEGHNYTYVGSTWGRIVDALIKSKCMNPIIYIDELDKISKTEHGKEIVGILTHMTDLSQNEEFADKYFSGIKFDISKCLIIFSYNDPSLIDKILLDRIHRIRIKAITSDDKIIICKKYILPTIFAHVGYSRQDILFADDVLRFIIDHYTLEAGVRKLKEKLYELVREVNIQYLSEKIELPFQVTKTFVSELFYKYDKVESKMIHRTNTIGLINGLYATSLGVGGITTIEVVKNFSKKDLELQLTGHQGNIMKESMAVAKTVALNYIAKHYPDQSSECLQPTKTFGLHIHCPAAATPKDGPSAGAAITVAIVSQLVQQPIKTTFAITGEVDLCGNVLKIGGLESKLHGAKRAGVKVVLCPSENKHDVEKITQSNHRLFEKGVFEVHLVHHIHECLELLLCEE